MSTGIDQLNADPGFFELGGGLMKNTFVGSMVLGLMLVASPMLWATVLPIDDFDDGFDLSAWTPVDTSIGQPWGPGVYDASSGALRIYHSGDELVPPGEPFTSTAMFALWNPSADPLYSNGYLRAKVRTNEVHNSTSVILRGDLTTATGYLLLGVTRPPTDMPEFEGSLGISKFFNGVETSIWRGWEDGINYRPGEDWNVELGAVGARITAKVWKVGDLEPDKPQFDWIDPEPILSGMIALSSDKVLGNTVPARGDATFDDLTFCVPEPATGLLLMAGTLAAISSRSRKANNCTRYDCD